VRVVNEDGAPVSGATVEVIDESSGYSEETGGSGTVTFSSVAEGAVDINVTGPSECTDEYGQIVMGKEPLTVDVQLDCSVDLPDQPAACDPDKYTEVFDPCGRAVLKQATECLGKTYVDYGKCVGKNDWKCAGRTAWKFWNCRKELDHKRRIQACNDQANAASNCNYKGPLD
jgi:hypothetical protein